MDARGSWALWLLQLMPYPLAAVSRRPSHHLLLCLFTVAALGVGTVGCGSDDEGVSDERVFGDTREKRARSSPGTISGRFDVGGHKLYLECTGKGSPTVVYLHGSVRQKGDAGGERAGRIPALLEARHRVCVYDRANVGRSDSVPGRVTGRDSAKDLHALIGSAGLKGPFVLLGSSLGGAISDLYAAAYPRDVAGMVLLDSTLPAYLEMYKRLYPPGSGPQPGEWKREAERLDRLATFRQARQVQGQSRKIPVTYVGATVSLPPKIKAAIRSAQRAFVNRFSPGRMIVVDAPHDMAAAIPERVAKEVDRVIAVTKRR